jgi:phospholipid/cholesterol/gamma-HCH transport system substrate-binding protein
VITRTTKVQLLVFALITLLGCSYVGAHYARLDRFVVDDTYTVSADFAESGGIFVGAEVSYRGVPVGRVEAMSLDRDGVRVDLGINNDVDAIPADAEAVVANRSAVGEQYVDLQPRTDDGPYLHDDSVIARPDTRTPVAPTTLLVDLDRLVGSVDERHLRTVVAELGVAFYDSGPDLSRIINTGNSFISTASDNIDVTARLLANTDTALSTQLASESAIGSFARNLRLFSDSLAASDPALRTVIDDGGRAAATVRTLIADNAETVSRLLADVVTTDRVVVAHLDGLEQVLVIYPYVVEGGYTVVAKDPLTGLYDAHFGLVLTQDPPVCHQGYGSSQREPTDLSEKRMDRSAHCEEPQAQSNARGAQNAPGNGSPVVARYDPATQTLAPTWRNPDARTSLVGGEGSLLGDDAWKWLLLGPLGRSAGDD